MHSDSRLITVGNVGTKPNAQKQPNDVFDYTLDFSNWLDDGQTVVDSPLPTVTIDGSGDTPPTNPSITVATDGKSVLIRIAGGSDGWSGVVTVLATMSDTQVKEVEFNLLVREINIRS